MAELSQPGTGAAAASPRPHRDAFAADRDRPRILCVQCDRRHCGVSFGGGAARTDPRPSGGRHRSDRQRLRKDLARPDRVPTCGRARSQTQLCHVQDHRRRRRGPRVGPRRPQWPERRGSDRPGRGLAEAKRSRLLPGSDPARSHTNLRLAARPRSLQRTHRGTAPADGPRRDADLRKRRKAVRHFHGQCRYAARVRPRPFIGVAGREYLSRQPVRRLSHSSGSFARIRRAARQAQ